MLKLCVVQGVQACNLGVSILAEELGRGSAIRKMTQSSMAGYVEVARLDQLPSGKGATATVAGKEIALFNVEGTIYAMDDGCLHHGVSLGNSALNGKNVTCRGHGWKYDVTKGSTLSSPGYGVPTYPVKVVDGRILIEISSGD